MLALSIAVSGGWLAPSVASALLVDLDTISTPRSTEPGAVSVHPCTFVTGATPGGVCRLLADFGSIGYAANEQPVGDFFDEPLVAPSSLSLVWTDGHRALAGGARLLWTGLAPGAYQITLISHDPIGTTIDSTIFEVNGGAPLEILNVPNPAPGSDLFALQSLTVPVQVDASGRIEIRYRAGLSSGIGVLNGLVLVPEPGSALLLGLGLCALRSCGRRRRAIGTMAAALLFAASLALPASALLQDVEPGNDDRFAPPTSLARMTGMVADGGRLELGSTEDCTNGVQCDLDFIALTGLRAGDFVAVSTTLRGDLGLAEPDTLAAILDSSGFLMATDEDLEIPSRVGFRVAEDGDYVVGLTGTLDNQLAGDHAEIGPYELSVAIFPNITLSGQTVRDREPFNDSIASLNTISEAIERGPERSIFAGSFTLAESIDCLDAIEPCDVDFVKLTGMVTGDLMTIATFPVGDPGDPDPFVPDTFVGIFDAAGQPLETEIDNSAGSLLAFSVPTDGDYFVGVTGTVDDFFDGDHSETGPYKLMISLFPVPEPAQAALGGVAVASLQLLARFKQRCGG